MNLYKSMGGGWVVKTEKRIWTARSVTKVEVVDQQTVSDFIKLVIDRLASDGMIPK